MKSAEKFLALVFLDAKDILLTDWLSFNWYNYCENVPTNLIDQLKKRRNKGLSKKKIIFYKDTQPHTSVVAMAKINELGYSMICCYIHYFPYLASSDIHLFPTLKKFLRGQSFATYEEIKALVEEYLHSCRNRLPWCHTGFGTSLVKVKGDYTRTISKR